MKKIFFIIVFFVIMFQNSLLFSQSDTKREEDIHFMGFSFANVTSVSQSNVDNEQLYGLYTSNLTLKNRGSEYSRFGIMYNYSAQDAKGIIGIPFPEGKELLGLESETLTVPLRHGWVFRPVKSPEFDLLLIPAIGTSFFLTDIEFNTEEESGEEKFTKYSGYMIGLDMSLAFDVSMLHRFSNIYLRYGVELNFPMLQFSASRMTKESGSDGVYYGNLQKASSDDFLSVVDVFKFEASPYIAIGFRSFSNFFDDPFDEIEDTLAKK